MYEQTVKLNHDEGLAKINKRTGEIKEVSKRKNNIPDGSSLFLPSGSFFKGYKKIHEYLVKNLTAEEKRVVDIMVMMAKNNTNSLIPLNDSMTAKRLGEYFSINERRIKIILTKLFEMGVYAKFEVVRVNDVFEPEYKKYWILSPYISFTGRLISNDIRLLFDGTLLERHYYK